jgi:hypothetical protein
MQVPRPLGVGLSLVVLLAACSGGPAATQGPGAATQGPGAATTDPGGGGTGATSDPGGGGGSSFANGKGHFEVSGSSPKSGDLGFFPLASQFGGMDATVLNFTAENTDQTETLTVTVSGGGQVAVIYASLDLTVTGVVCTSSDLKVEAASASGSFDCSQTLTMTSAGASLEGVTLKGNFEAHK